MVNFIPKHILNTEPEVPDVVKQAQEIMKGKKAPESSWSSLISLKDYLYDLMIEAGIDKDDIKSYINDVNYDLKYVDIVRAFKEFVASDRTMRSKERYLFPIFTEISGNIKVEHHPKKVKTASEIISEKERLSLGIPTVQIYGKGKNYVLKPEEELPQIVPAEEVRAGYVDKMRKGKETKCELCGEVIKPDQIRGWWLSIYPAHMSCIQAELNRRAISAGRRIPFPELRS